MTDLEMTKLCAKAMGWRPAGERDDFDTVKAIPVEQFPGAPHYQYGPLRNDSEAMALVKAYKLDIYGADSEAWGVQFMFGPNQKTSNANLNRAIVECVAKMQAAK